MSDYLSSPFEFSQANDYGQPVDIKSSSKELYYIGVLSPNQKNNDGPIYSYNSREIDSLSDKYDETFRDGYYNRTLYNHRGQLPVGEIYMGCRNDNNDFCTFGRIGGDTYAGRKAIMGVVDGSMQGLSAGLSTQTATDHSSLLPIVEPKARTFIEGSVTGDPCYDDTTYIKYYSDEPGYLLEKIANLVDVDNGDPTRNIQRLPKSLQALPEIMREQIRQGKRFVLPQEQRTHASRTFSQGRQKQGGKSAVAQMRDFFSLVAQKGRNPDGSVNLSAVDHFFVQDSNIQKGGVVDRAVRTRHNKLGAKFVGHPGASGGIETFLDGTEDMTDTFDHVEALMKSTGANVLSLTVKDQSAKPTQSTTKTTASKGGVQPVNKTIFKTLVKDTQNTPEKPAAKGGLSDSVRTALAHKEQISQEQYDETLKAAQGVFMQALGRFSQDNEADTEYSLKWLKDSLQTKEAFEEAKKVKGFEELAGAFSTLKEARDNKPAISSENIGTTATKGIGKLPKFNLLQSSGGGKSTFPSTAPLSPQAEPRPLQNGVTVPVVAGEEPEEGDDYEMKTDAEGQEADTTEDEANQEPQKNVRFQKVEGEEKDADAMDEVEQGDDETGNADEEEETPARPHQKTILKKQMTTASSQKLEKQSPSKAAKTAAKKTKTTASAAPKESKTAPVPKGIDETKVASFFKEMDDPETAELFGLGAHLAKKMGAKSKKDLIDIISKQKAMEIENEEMKKQLSDVAKEKKMAQQRAETKSKNEEAWSKAEGLLEDVEDVIRHPNGPLSRDQLAHLSELEKAKDTGSRLIEIGDLAKVMEIHTTATKWKAQAGDQAMKESKLKAKNNMAKKLKNAIQDLDQQVEEGVKEKLKASPFVKNKSIQRPTSSQAPGNSRTQKLNSTQQRQAPGQNLHMEKVRPRQASGNGSNPNLRSQTSSAEFERPSEAVFRNATQEHSNAVKQAAAQLGQDPSHFVQARETGGQSLTWDTVYSTASKYMPDEESDGMINWESLFEMAKDPAIGGLSSEEFKYNCERMLRTRALPEHYALGGYIATTKGIEFA